MALGACAAAPRVQGRVEGQRVALSVAELTAAAAGGTGVVVTLAERRESVVLLKDGQGWLAFSGRCTHRGCQVVPEGEGMGCPCHGSVFDRRGQVLKGPAPEPLPSLEVVIEGDTLLVAAP